MENIKSDIFRAIVSSAGSYYDIGLAEFHAARKSNWKNFQPALGNLCIAIELTLKSLIAYKCPSYLFCNLPFEIELHLAYPTAAPTHKAMKIYERDLKEFAYKTIEFERCILIFYALFPSQRQNYKPYFSALIPIRNLSIHGAIQQFQKYDLERVAYIAIDLWRFLKKEDIPFYKLHRDSKEDKEFHTGFDIKRTDRVKTAIDKARQNAKQIDKVEKLYLDSWEQHEAECPVCGNCGVLNGETHYDAIVNEDTEEEIDGLTFYAESFKCPACGLELFDSEELSLAGLETAIDRTRDFDRWSNDMSRFQDESGE